MKGSLFEQLAVEMQKRIEKSTEFDVCKFNEGFRTKALKALKEKKYSIDLTLSEIIAITHFTHPFRPATMYAVITLFQDNE